jgi:GAF domain-containing protein
MVDILWQAGYQTAALQLEELWNRLLERHDFILLCAYSAEGFVGDLASIDALVAAHTHITGSFRGSASRSNGNNGEADTASSTRRIQETKRAAESKRAERLLRITTAIADAVSPPEVYEALVDSVGEAIGSSSSGLWLLDQSSKIARLARSRGYTEAVVAHLTELHLDMEPGLPVLDSMRRNQPVWIDSKGNLLEAYPHLKAVTTEGRRYKVACLPLHSQGRVLGALGVTIESEGSLSEEERGFLLVVARYASQALERLRLLVAERTSRNAAQSAAHRLQVMARISRAFVEADLALPTRLHVVTRELAAALDGCINISLLEADHQLHFAAVHHPDAEANAQLQQLAARESIALGEGVTGTIAQSKRSVLMNALEPEIVAANAPPAYASFLRRFPPSALIGAPLTVQGRLIGTVTATRVRAGQTYTTDDLSLLEELADRAAVAIENGRL